MNRRRIIDLKLLKDLPKCHAIRILKYRRKKHRWLIERMINLKPTQIWPPVIGFVDCACVYGDEDDMLDVVFALKDECKPRHLNSFRHAPMEKK